MALDTKMEVRMTAVEIERQELYSIYTCTGYRYIHTKAIAYVKGVCVYVCIVNTKGMYSTLLHAWYK